MPTASHRPTRATKSGNSRSSSFSFVVSTTVPPGFMPAKISTVRANGGIDADDAIGMVDVGHRPDRRAIEAQKGGNRRAAAFEAERGNRDRVFALVDQRLRENRTGQDGALAAPPVNAHLVHFVHGLLRNSQEALYGLFLTLLRACVSSRHDSATDTLISINSLQCEDERIHHHAVEQREPLRRCCCADREPERGYGRQDRQREPRSDLHVGKRPQRAAFGSVRIHGNCFCRQGAAVSRDLYPPFRGGEKVGAYPA